MVAAGMPRKAPTRSPYASEPAAQPISAPAPMPAAVTVISRAPAPAGSNVWRAAIICSASISAHFVTPEVHFRSDFGPDLVSGGAAGLLLRLAAPAPDAGVGELHDLEQVDHVHRRADREQTERD